MSKKEQKLKKNLYKALTEYFIHNPKNNLTSSVNITVRQSRQSGVARATCPD